MPRLYKTRGVSESFTASNQLRTSGTEVRCFSAFYANHAESLPFALDVSLRFGKHTTGRFNREGFLFVFFETTASSVDSVLETPTFRQSKPLWVQCDLDRTKCARSKLKVVNICPSQS